MPPVDPFDLLDWNIANFAVVLIVTGISIELVGVSFFITPQTLIGIGLLVGLVEFIPTVIMKWRVAAQPLKQDQNQEKEDAAIYIVESISELEEAERLNWGEETNSDSNDDT